MKGGDDSETSADQGGARAGAAIHLTQTHTMCTYTHSFFGNSLLTGGKP